MTFTEIPKGTFNWDVNVNAAFADIQNQITTGESTQDVVNTEVDTRLDNLELPTNRGLLAWNYDPAMGSATTAPGTDQQLYMLGVTPPRSGVANQIHLGVGAAGSGFVAGQNHVGLYDSSGNLLSGCVDPTTEWASTGLKTHLLSVPQAVTGGSTYYIGFIMNATTKPTLLRGLSITALADVVNVGLTASNARWSIDGTGLTALPATVNLSSRTFLGSTWWAAIA